MQIVDRGLVLRETPYKEADVMLSVLTECGGKLSVLAKGAKRKGSRMTAAIQLFTYSEFSMYESNGRYTLNEAEPVEMFYGVRKDIVKLALASYFAEVLEQASDEETIDPELLRLGLNSLYAISETGIPLEKVKAVFELKVAQLSGYSPNLFFCGICNKNEQLSGFDIQNGSVVCEVCGGKHHHVIDPAVLDAMRFVLNADVKHVFSFKINEKSMNIFSKITDAYLKTHFGRNFKTNAFYKSLL